MTPQKGKLYYLSNHGLHIGICLDDIGQYYFGLNGADDAIIHQFLVNKEIKYFRRCDIVHEIK